jgi:hypothetical protein
VDDALATIRIDRDGVSTAPVAAHAAAVVETLRSLRGERDATLEIVPIGRDVRLLIAIDGSDAFLGLVEGEAIYELADPRRAGGPMRHFTIGRQGASIGSDYCLSLNAAATVVEGWLAGSTLPPPLRWVNC